MSATLLDLPQPFWFMFGGALVNSLGGFVVPFLAFYLTQQLRLPVTRVGLISMLHGLGALAAGPVGGVMADRVGRRPTMVLSLVLSAMALLGLGRARSPTALGLGACCLGAVGNLYRPAMSACVADLVPPASWARAYGYMYWAINLGFAMASMMAGSIASHGYGLLFVVNACTCLACAAIIWRFVPESRPVALPKEVAASPVSPLVPLRDRVFLVFVALNFLLAVIFQQGTVALPVSMQNAGLSAGQFGRLIAINGIIIVLLQPFAGRFVQRFRRSRVLAAGALLTGTGFSLTAFATTPVLYGATIILWTLGEIAIAPINPTVVSDLAKPDLRGTYQGVFGASWSAAACAAPVLGSVVMGKLGAPTLWAGCFALGVLVAAGHLGAAAPRARHLSASRVGGEPLPAAD